MTYHLRAVTDSDYGWLYQLRRAAYLDVVRRQFGDWEESLQSSMFQARWKPETMQIVLLDGVAIGVIAVEQHDDHVRLVEIQLKEGAQGQGLGTGLILDILRRAREQGMPLRLQVLHQNYRAKSLYERLGFRTIQTTEHHDVMEA